MCIYIYISYTPSSSSSLYIYIGTKLPGSQLPTRLRLGGDFPQPPWLGVPPQVMMPMLPAWCIWKAAFVPWVPRKGTASVAVGRFGEGRGGAVGKYHHVTSYKSILICIIYFNMYWICEKPRDLFMNLHHICYMINCKDNGSEYHHYAWGTPWGLLTRPQTTLDWSASRTESSEFHRNKYKCNLTIFFYLSLLRFHLFLFDTFKIDICQSRFSFQRFVSLLRSAAFAENLWCRGCFYMMSMVATYSRQWRKKGIEMRWVERISQAVLCCVAICFQSATLDGLQLRLIVSWLVVWASVFLP